MQSSPLPRRIRHGVSLSTAALLATTSSLSWAHAGLDGGAHHGFAAGLMHPITGPDHLAAMLAVGIWSALATRRLWLAPLSFAALLLIGALASQWGLVLPGVEPMIAASLLIMGLLIVGRTHLPEWSGAVLVGVFAMFHGAAHGQELDGHWALAGMVISTAVLHGLGIAIGAGLRRTPAWISTTAGMAVSGLGLLMTAKLMTA